MFYLHTNSHNYTYWKRLFFENTANCPKNKHNCKQREKENIFTFWITLWKDDYFHWIFVCLLESFWDWLRFLENLDSFLHRVGRAHPSCNYIKTEKFEIPKLAVPIALKQQGFEDLGKEFIRQTHSWENLRYKVNKPTKVLWNANSIIFSFCYRANLLICMYVCNCELTK